MMLTCCDLDMSHQRGLLESKSHIAEWLYWQLT